MAPALEEAIERLRKMPPDRQEAFARMLLREILADEQWRRSTAMNAEWRHQQQVIQQQRASQSVRLPS